MAWAVTLSGAGPVQLSAVAQDALVPPVQVAAIEDVMSNAEPAAAKRIEVFFFTVRVCFSARWLDAKSDGMREKWKMVRLALFQTNAGQSLEHLSRVKNSPKTVTLADYMMGRFGSYVAVTMNELGCFKEPSPGGVRNWRVLRILESLPRRSRFPRFR